LLATAVFPFNKRSILRLGKNPQVSVFIKIKPPFSSI